MACSTLEKGSHFGSRLNLGMLVCVILFSAGAFVAPAPRLPSETPRLAAREARRAALWMSEFKVQEIANTAWAFAKLDLLDDKLFAT